MTANQEKKTNKQIKKQNQDNMVLTDEDDRTNLCTSRISLLPPER